MKPTLQELYEKTLVVEVVGAQNYWITPSGDLIKVDDHIDYATNNFNVSMDIKFGEDPDYDPFYKAGYIRVVENTASIYFSYNRARHPDRIQFMTLYGMAQDKNKNLVDDETQKVIIKNNEVEPDVARNDKLDKLDQEMQPSFYRKRGRYGENFSKYGLADYTKLLYEGKSGHGDEKAVTNLLKDYINRW